MIWSLPTRLAPHAPARGLVCLLVEWVTATLAQRAEYPPGSPRAGTLCRQGWPSLRGQRRSRRKPCLAPKRCLGPTWSTCLAEGWPRLPHAAQAAGRGCGGNPLGTLESPELHGAAAGATNAPMRSLPAEDTGAPAASREAPWGPQGHCSLHLHWSHVRVHDPKRGHLQGFQAKGMDPWQASPDPTRGNNQESPHGWSLAGVRPGSGSSVCGRKGPGWHLVGVELPSVPAAWHWAELRARSGYNCQRRCAQVPPTERREQTPSRIPLGRAVPSLGWGAGRDGR